MVSLRDGKTYDPASSVEAPSSAGGLQTRSRRSSTATVSQANRPTTRRSARLANSNAEAFDSEVTPIRAAREDAASTPLSTRGKRARPQQLVAVLAEAVVADVEEMDLPDKPDVGTSDQGVLEAAELQLPDEPSPSSMPPSSKKARFPTDDVPATGSKAAAKQLKAAVHVNIAAAAVVLLAAIAVAAFLPAFAPQRAAFQSSLAHAQQEYLLPWQVRAGQALDRAGQALTSGKASAAQLLRDAAATSQQHLEAILLQLHVRWPKIVPPAADQRGSTEEDAVAVWSADVLASVLPASEAWAELAADISERLRTPAAARSNKAPAVLLACGSIEDCDEAAASLAMLPPKGEECRLDIQSSSLQQATDSNTNSNQPAAVLQSLLAPFLQRCPQGLVVLRGVQDFPVAAVPALNNALSEQGGFQHNGAVDGSKAAYVLLLQVPAQHVAAAAAHTDSTAVENAIKDGLFTLLQEQYEQEAAAAATAALEAAAAEGVEDEAELRAKGVAAAEAQWGAVKRGLGSLHRRIDFAAPIRLGRMPDEGFDAAADGAEVEEGQAGTITEEEEQLYAQQEAAEAI